MSFDIQRLVDLVTQKIKEETEKPFVISIMGQTGVGKSSLINALFGTKLKTDPVRPCTKEIERIVVQGNDGYELWFYDLPGIGESNKADPEYLDQYREQLMVSDVVIWAFHADSRSVTFDLNSLQRILQPLDKTQRVQLMSKITFVLTKVDLLTPPPWILGKVADDGIFAPAKETKYLLAQKAAYYQEVFLQAWGGLITSKTYNDENFNITQYPLSYDENHVYYEGLLTEKMLVQLTTQFPKYRAVFDRLYDNYRVIPCSSLFRFNLTQLMLVIINKLGPTAINRFNNFYKNEMMNRVPFTTAKTYCNIVIFEQS